MGVVKIELEGDFESKVKGAAAGKLVVVDFFATWCGPCRMISPKLEVMSGEFDSVLFFKIDVDELESVAAQCGISAMPTFKFYKDGKEIAEVVGASEENIRKKINELK